jgi:ribonucleoside-diphosphate reductase alpha subunit
MLVTKRSGVSEAVQFDKITNRIRHLAESLDVDCAEIARLVIGKMYSLIKTSELDRLAATTAAGKITTHKDYYTLAGRILVSNLHKSTPSSFSQCMIALNRWKPHVLEVIRSGVFDEFIVHDREYLIEYNGMQSAIASYLENIDGVIYDRYQYLLMRVAIATCPDFKNLALPVPPKTLEFIVKSYNYLSCLDYTNATPSLYNSCKLNMQLVSCFLYGTDDTIESIMDTVKNTALISKHGGGIGIHHHNIRSQNRPIVSTNGKASGLPRQLKIYNETGLTFDQGGRRKGAISNYVEPWHGDIFDILKLKLNQGDDSLRTKDLFFGMWIPDLFVKCCKEESDWYLFSADNAPYLSDVYDGMLVCTECGHCKNGAYNKYICDVIAKCTISDSTRGCNYQPKDVFTELYYKYVAERRYVLQTKATIVLDMMVAAQGEGGGPYVLQKDHINRMSNQMNIGTIKSSNLCTEIVEWSNHESYASCVLGSINLKNMYCPMTKTVDWAKLHRVAGHLTEVLDNVISSNDYPVPECVGNAQDYRPIGIGIQGLANLLCLLRLPFDSDEAGSIDTRIMECIYHGALSASCRLAKERGAHVGFEDSPSASGKLSLHLWKQNQQRIQSTQGVQTGSELTVREHYDWQKMAKKVATYGRRNSLLIAPMPTAATANLLGNNESFEPFHSNAYTKSSGNKYIVYNRHLIDDLTELGLWNPEMEQRIVLNGGSVQQITEIPDSIRSIYKIVSEIKQSTLMKRAACRQAFVDQSQSLNLVISSNNPSVLKGIFYTAWSLGLKTGSYYIRTPSGTTPLKNLIVDNKLKEDEVCAIGCTSCSS